MSGIIQSNEFFINIKPKDIPKWNNKLSYFEQDLDTIVFYENELKKIREGITINGVFIHPWLYWHVNFFKARITQKDGSEPIINPYLDDHAWYFAENYKEAEEQEKGVCMFGTRGFSKTVLESSVALWTAVTRFNGIININGGSSKDLKDVCQGIKLGNENLESFLKLPILTEDWDKDVMFGIRETNSTIFQSRLDILNLEEGKGKASEKAAGGTPAGWLADEIGKFDPRALLDASKPKFYSQYGAKLVHILSGCVCAGTKVWDNNGNLINIEDLNPENGILGFDIENRKVSKENITYWQAPHEKPCYRITTNKGRILECSNDHPILTRDRYKNGAIKKKSYIFKDAKDLNINDSLCIVNGLPDEFFNGTEKMFDPYLVGMAIGDGCIQKNGSVMIFNSDDEVKNYIKSKYHTNTVFKEDTKDGRVLEKFTVAGITKEMRNLGLNGKSRENKRLPENLYKFRKKDIIELINGYFDADGCFYINRNMKKSSRNRTDECLIKLTSCGRVILEEVQMLLTKFGIHSNIVYERLTENSSPKSTRGHYNLIIKTSESMVRFSEIFKPKIKYKAKNLKDIGKTWSGIVKTINQPMVFERVRFIEDIGVKPVYNLTAGNTHTYIANGIITHNTGGNSELSEGAKIVLENPDDYKLIRMNWDRLDNSIPEEAITWKETRGTTFCTFVPGQMSYRIPVPKIEKTLDVFTGNIGKNWLKKIKIFQTDWINATKHLKNEIDLLSTDDAKNKQRMYHPMETTDCFLIDSPNPFNVSRLTIKLNEIKNDPKYRLVELYSDVDGKVQHRLSEKKLAEREYKNKDIDAPIMLFEDRDTEAGEYYYTSGIDDYKLTNAKESTSLGTIYVLKRRNVEVNSPIEKMVLAYASRPHQSHNILYDNFRLSLKKFNCLANIEAIDVGFANYLETLGFNMMDYLTDNLNPSNDLTSTKKTKSNSRYGTYPTPGNVKLMFDTVLEYTNEPVTVGWIGEEPLIKYGCDFIEDPYLIEEMINYKSGGNFDRIVAFGWALLYARFLDKKNIKPKRNKIYSDSYYEKGYEDKWNNRKKINIGFNNFARTNYQNF